MEALIDVAPLHGRDRIDLVRGALDAWLHPPAPSSIPAVAAIVGGGLWTVAAAAVVLQPAPPQWPGYLLEIVGLALVAAGFLLVATLGCTLRAEGRGRRPKALAVAVTIAGYAAWIGALAATAAGVLDGPTLAVAQTIAMLGSALTGAVLLRVGDEAIGLLILTGAIAMLVPWTTLWLVLGASWTAVGCILAAQRIRGPGDWRVS